MPRLLLAVAVLLHLAVGFLYVTAGLVAPGGALLVLQPLWLALMIGLVVVGPRRPVLALGVPVLALGVLMGALIAGDALLGWTA